MDPSRIETLLRDEIERGLLHPGTCLKQEQLASRFAVSRQPVRQALERLVAAGLLERRSDRTLTVTGLSRQAAAELIGVRVVLETSALRASLPKLDEVVLRKAKRLAESLLDADDAAEIEELDVSFHRLLYSRGGNNRMLSMIDALRREGRRVYARQPKDASYRASLHAEHQVILDACQANDAEGAVAALTTHLNGTLTQIASDSGDQQ